MLCNDPERDDSSARRFDETRDSWFNLWIWCWLQEDRFRACPTKVSNGTLCAFVKKMDCSVRMPQLKGNPINQVLILLIRLYQVTLSPLKTILLGPGARCRFHPTCSQYAAESLRIHGFFKGGAYALRRILRCHPWGGSGYDPVPGTPPSPEAFHDPEHLRH